MSALPLSPSCLLHRHRRCWACGPHSRSCLGSQSPGNPRYSGREPWTVDLYEAELSLEARRVGGRDLGKKTILAVIEAAGVLNRFKDFSRPEGQEMRAMTPGSDLLAHKKGDAGESSAAYSLEVDRADLNRVLFEAVPSIHWGHNLKDIQPVDVTNEYGLWFMNGTSAITDLAVGVDGAWSRVRPLVTPEQPSYSGTVFLDCTLRDFDSLFPELVDLDGYGSLYAFGGGKVLAAQRDGYGVLRPTWASRHRLIGSKRRRSCKR